MLICHTLFWRHLSLCSSSVYFVPMSYVRLLYSIISVEGIFYVHASTLPFYHVLIIKVIHLTLVVFPVAWQEE